jgi:hypothetical protein
LKVEAYNTTGHDASASRTPADLPNGTVTLHKHATPSIM